MGEAHHAAAKVHPTSHSRQPRRKIGVYPGFPIRLGALPGFVVGDLMWKALWKLVENEQRFPRRGGRVLCVHGAVSFHRARPCGRPVCRPGRDEGSLEPYRQNCDESGLQISPPGPLRCHDLPDRGQPRYSCTDSEPFAYPVREAETAIKQASSEHFIVGKPGYSQRSCSVSLKHPLFLRSLPADQLRFRLPMFGDVMTCSHTLCFTKQRGGRTLRERLRRGCRPTNCTDRRSLPASTHPRLCRWRLHMCMRCSP